TSGRTPTPLCNRNAVWAELAQAFNEAFSHFPNRPPSSVGSNLKTLWKRAEGGVPGSGWRSRGARNSRQPACPSLLTHNRLLHICYKYPPTFHLCSGSVMALVPNLITKPRGHGWRMAAMAWSQTVHKGPGKQLILHSGKHRVDASSLNKVKDLIGMFSFSFSYRRVLASCISIFLQELESKELVAINLGLASPIEHPQNSATSPGPAPSSPSHQFLTHSTSRATAHRSSLSRVSSGLGSGSRGLTFDAPRRGSIAPPHIPVLAPAENSFAFADARGLDSAGWEARRQEVLEQEHQQTMSLLLLQQCVWEEKRRAARQKEKAARAKKRYYQAKLRKLGAEMLASGSDSDEDHPQT
ncbi:hypothetical protein NFI96_031744, partial [Prochilodus magdalenae]